MLLSAEATSGLPVTFRVLSGNAEIKGNRLTISGRSTVRIAAEQQGNLAFLPALTQTQQIFGRESQPPGRDDEYLSASGELLSVEAPGVLNNDGAEEGASVVLTRQAKHGYVELGTDGSFNYRSQRGFVGVDTFRYRIVSGARQSREVSVLIRVTPS